MILLDTNVVIRYIQNHDVAVSWIEFQRARGEKFCISTLTIVELLGFPKATEIELYWIDFWIRSQLVIDVDSAIAREAARLRRMYKLKTVDSVIAATGSMLHAPIATFDNDFKKIRAVRTVVPK